MDPAVELVVLPLRALEALAAGDLHGARRAAGLELPDAFLADDALWRLRAAQAAAEPDVARWVLVRAMVARDGGTVVGHTGFHAAPDATGMVEVGYQVLPRHRRRGYARAALAMLIADAGAHGARTVRASVSPDNEPSLALVRSFGFRRVAEQWDEEDGLELVFERPAPDGHS